MSFTLIIKDRSEFGTVGLAGMHNVIECEHDVANILHSVERDGFDRVFVYVDGFDGCTFDIETVQSLVAQLIQGGGVLKMPGHVAKRWQSIADLLTLNQYRAVTGSLSYREMFEGASKVSKRGAVKQLASQGLVYLSVMGF